jgi:hypothetical protein
MCSRSRELQYSYNWCIDIFWTGLDEANGEIWGQPQDEDRNYCEIIDRTTVWKETMHRYFPVGFEYCRLQCVTLNDCCLLLLVSAPNCNLQQY